MKHYTVLFIIAIFFSGCNNHSGAANKQQQIQAQIESWKAELLKTDKQFSKSSGDNGCSVAFVSYASDSAILLHPFSMPVMGKDSIRVFFKNRQDSLNKLIWEPLGADVGDGGNIGYTYGIYTLYLWGIGLGKEHGTYSTVWKKENGSWKFVLTAANQGLSPAERAGYHDMNSDLRKEERNDEKKK